MELVVGSCMPERTVLLRVDPDAAHARGQQRLAAGEDDGSDRFESEGVEFQRAVAAAYDEIAARHPGPDHRRRRRRRARRGAPRDHGGGGPMSELPESPRRRDRRPAGGAGRACRCARGAVSRLPLLRARRVGQGERRAGVRGRAPRARRARSRLRAPAGAADPSPHPDLAWLRPPGAQHLVEEVRERIIEAAPYRPFEGEHRVFVVEQADAMAEESQNALLKTLEEPATFAHIILVSSQPSALLETVRSRCQAIAFAALSPEALAERLARTHRRGAIPPRSRAAARLAGGDLELAALAALRHRARAARPGRGARPRRAGRRARLLAVEGAPRCGREARARRPARR